MIGGVVFIIPGKFLGIDRDTPIPGGDGWRLHLPVGKISPDRDPFSPFGFGEHKKTGTCVHCRIKPGIHARIGRMPSITACKYFSSAVLRKAHFSGYGIFQGEEIVSPCADMTRFFTGP